MTQDNITMTKNQIKRIQALGIHYHSSFEDEGVKIYHFIDYKSKIKLDISYKGIWYMGDKDDTMSYDLLNKLNTILRTSFKAVKSVKALNIRDTKNDPLARQAMGLFKHVAYKKKITQADMLILLMNAMNKMLKEEECKK
ncbi:MAG: hypothetical protein HRT98_04485 [Mycoplasmatales bacterium]|nr:hypothetical protein [Mycoplasmatales bacterium]